MGARPVVDALCAANAELLRGRRAQARARRVAARRARRSSTIVDEPARGALPGALRRRPTSPTRASDYFVGHTLDAALRALAGAGAARPALRCDARRRRLRRVRAPRRAPAIARASPRACPPCARCSAPTSRAAYEGDPAATSVDEVVFCYPGITAITHHRIAHELYALGVPLIPRIIAELAHGATGIDIHPGAQHRRELLHRPRHRRRHRRDVRSSASACASTRASRSARRASRPTSDGRARSRASRATRSSRTTSIIYAGATILGRITIGRGSSIGGNVWLTHSVPPGAASQPAPPRALRRRLGDLMA